MQVKMDTIHSHGASMPSCNPLVTLLQVDRMSKGSRTTEEAQTSAKK